MEPEVGFPAARRSREASPTGTFRYSRTPFGARERGARPQRSDAASPATRGPLSPCSTGACAPSRGPGAIWLASCSAKGRSMAGSSVRRSESCPAQPDICEIAGPSLGSGPAADRGAAANLPNFQWLHVIEETTGANACGGVPDLEAAADVVPATLDSAVGAGRPRRHSDRDDANSDLACMGCTLGENAASPPVRGHAGGGGRAAQRPSGAAGAAKRARRNGRVETACTSPGWPVPPGRPRRRSAATAP